MYEKHVTVTIHAHKTRAARRRHQEKIRRERVLRTLAKTGAVCAIAMLVIAAMASCVTGVCAVRQEDDRHQASFRPILAVAPVQAANSGTDDTPVLPEDMPEPEPVLPDKPAEPVPPENPWTDTDVDNLAKTVWGEALITHSDEHMSGVAWCVLNRVDSSRFPDDITSVVTQKSQFDGYDPDNPVDEHVRWLVEDVLARWQAEKSGETDVGRTLPSDYLYFLGDGRVNEFTKEYFGKDPWDWSLPNPYGN